MKYAQVYPFVLMAVFHTSCGPNQTIATSPGFNKSNFHTKYEYTDPAGKRLIIQNSFPRGGTKYTAPDGKVYGYTVFWTQIINETANPFELMIDFPADALELSSSAGSYFKLFLPSDTMTIEKEDLFNYGLPDLKPFLDKSLQKAPSLKRTIHPKESGTFYVVTLFNRGVDGVLRAGLSLKGQYLFYSVNDKEIHCGKINLTLQGTPEKA